VTVRSDACNQRVPKAEPSGLNLINGSIKSVRECENALPPSDVDGLVMSKLWSFSTLQRPSKEERERRRREESAHLGRAFTFRRGEDSFLLDKRPPPGAIGSPSLAAALRQRARSASGRRGKDANGNYWHYLQAADAARRRGDVWDDPSSGYSSGGGPPPWWPQGRGGHPPPPGSAGVPPASSLPAGFATVERNPELRRRRMRERMARLARQHEEEQQRKHRVAAAAEADASGTR